MFTEMNTDNTLSIYDGLRECIKSEKEYERWCIDQLDKGDTQQTAMWRLHAQVYPYTKSNWMGACVVIFKIIESVLGRLNNVETFKFRLETDYDSKSMSSFRIHFDHLKKDITFDVLALNSDSSVFDYTPTFTVYVFQVWTTQIPFNLDCVDDIRKFCNRVAETIVGLLIVYNEFTLTEEEKNLLRNWIKEVTKDDFLYNELSNNNLITFLLNSRWSTKKELEIIKMLVLGDENEVTRIPVDCMKIVEFLDLTESDESQGVDHFKIDIMSIENRITGPIFKLDIYPWSLDGDTILGLPTTVEVDGEQFSRFINPKTIQDELIKIDKRYYYDEDEED